MRIASFFIRPASTEQDQQPASPPDGPSLISNFMVNAPASSNTPFVVSPNGIWNDHEPASSDEDPSPAFANFYKSDDFVYHRLAGKWKRTALKTFQQNP